MKELDILELNDVEMSAPRSGRVMFSVGEKVSLQKLVLQYRLHTKHSSVASKRNAWARLTQDFNSIKGYNRTEAQLRKCWDNIKTRRRSFLHKQAPIKPQPLEKRIQEEVLDLADPLMPVKNEPPPWRKQDGDTIEDDSDAASREFEVAEATLGGAASSRLPEEFHPSTDTHTQGSKLESRCQERLEELHRLKVAQQVWALKTLRERHATALLERERAQFERQRAREDSERARLEREKARFERDAAEFQRDKALLELDKNKRAAVEINYHK